MLILVEKSRRVFFLREMTVNNLKESLALLTDTSEGIFRSFKRRLSSTTSENEEKWNLAHFEKFINLEASVSEARSCR